MKKLKFSKATTERVEKIVRQRLSDESVDKAILAAMSDKTISNSLLYQMGIEVDDWWRERFRFRYEGSNKVLPIQAAMQPHIDSLAKEIVATMNDGTIVFSESEINKLKAAYKAEVKKRVRELVMDYAEEQADELFNEMVTFTIEDILDGD
jgi:hypothetical protein